jgi:hypothetical protein
MKKTITRTAIATLVLLLGLTISSYAQYYDLYLCDNVTPKLHTPEENGLTAGDKVHWFLDGVLVGTPIAYTGTAGSTDLVLPATLPANVVHTYTTRIETQGGCLGDLSDPYEVYKLPTKTLALTATNDVYCAGSSGNQTPKIDGSVITATTTPAQTLPAGFEYAYTWTVTENGNPSSPGTADASTTNESKYTMTTTTAGNYTFNATVKYVKTAANTGNFVSPSSEGCVVSATATKQIRVTPKPGKPTITLG